MATHCRILTWRIPWIEKPGGLQSMGSTEQLTLSSGPAAALQALPPDARLHGTQHENHVASPVSIYRDRELRPRKQGLAQGDLGD